MAAPEILPLPADTRPRDAVLERAVGEITKKFGDGAVMRLGEAWQLVVEAIPTGSQSLELALGVGGSRAGG
jgi:recombination protein RecA